jgi:phenylacetate-CoA ligase
MLNWRRSIIEFHDEYISGNSIPAHRKSLTRYHSLPAERRQREHAKRLSQLLRHAAQQVPYYRDRLGKIGVVRGDKVDLTRFREIPVLTRSILREEFEQLKSDDLARRSWYKNSSGGSTGEPV